eukprot:36632_1
MLPKINNTDNAQWIAFILIGLQMFDLISDVVLNIEILFECVKKKSNNKPTLLLYFAGIGGIFSVIIPYIANIIIAANIKKLVSSNSAAVSYFEQRASLFIMLVVFSGSAYSVLYLLSSRIFALDTFNSGLTSYELRQLLNIKIFASVILENIPQLFFQLLYTIYLNGIPSQNTLLSFMASFLSIIAAILNENNIAVINQSNSNGGNGKKTLSRQKKK